MTTSPATDAKAPTTKKATTKAPAKKTTTVKKATTTAAKKATPAKTTPAKKAAPAVKATATKKATPTKKTTTPKKTATRRKSVTVAEPHPAAEIGVIGNLTSGVLAHRIAATTVRDPQSGQVNFNRVLIDCTGAQARSLSYGFAKANGANACPACFGGSQ